MNSAQTLDRGFRPAMMGGVVAATVAASLVAGIALGGGFRGGNAAGGPVAGSPSPIVSPSPEPSATPTPVPSATPAPTPDPTPKPTPNPTPKPTPQPTPQHGGSDGMPIKVDLDNVTGADVYVDVVDYTDDVTGAESGHPGDGGSVPPFTLEVRNVDANTLKLTWLDYPIDNALALYVYRDGSSYRIVLIQPGPKGPTDSVGFDRILLLHFDRAVNAAAIDASLQGTEGNG